MNLPTPETYDELQRAYDFFNEKLFSNELPPCLITLQREKRTYGYCSFKRFVGREWVHGRRDRYESGVFLDQNHKGHAFNTGA